MTTWENIKLNPELIPVYQARERVVDTIRSFFKSRGFHEVFTPTLVSVPSCEPNLEVFETRLTTASGKSARAFLISSPEFAIKKLLAAGLGNVFEVTRSYRNAEEVSQTHNPEFTILEWYRIQSDYMAVAADFESLFQAIIGADTFTYQGVEYDISSPWPKISVAEAFAGYCHISPDELLDPAALIRAAAAKGYAVDASTTYEAVFSQLIFNEIEPRFRGSRRPMVFYDYPVSQASLSRRKPADPRFAERLEIFLAGIELGNCFSELTDWQEQQRRFESDLAERKAAGKTEFPLDTQLVAALKSGLPPVSGIAVGVDRLVMLAADVPDIASTLYFPARELFNL